MSNSIAIVSAVQFEVADTLVVADPCYIDMDDGSLEENMNSGILSRSTGGVVLADCAGTWIGKAEIADNDHTGGFGERVSRLILSRKGHRPTGPYNYIGANGVDSGQMGAFCATNIPVDYDKLLEAYMGEDGEWVNHLILAFGGGVVSSTGFGDGVYEVSARYDNDGNIALVEVDFFGEEEDDFYDE